MEKDVTITTTDVEFENFDDGSYRLCIYSNDPVIVLKLQEFACLITRAITELPPRKA